MKKVLALGAVGVIIITTSCSIFNDREEWAYYLSHENVVGSPAIDFNGNIYFSARGLYSLDPSGNLRWKYEEASTHPVIGDDGTIYSGGGGNLYAFNSDGSIKWQYPIGVGSIALGHDGTLYVASSEYLYALSPEGELLWEYKTGGFSTEPVIGADGAIYFALYNYWRSEGYVYALNPDGTLKWQYALEKEIRTSLAIGSNGTIYFATGAYYEGDTQMPGYLCAVSSEGSALWKSEVGGQITCSSVIASDGTIYIGTFETEGCYLYAIGSDGELKWKYEAYGWIHDPTVGSDGTIYLGSIKEGKKEAHRCLFALNPNGKLKWSYEVEHSVETPCAISPDGTIYFGSNGIDWEYECYLYAIRSNSSGLASSPWPKFGADNQNTGRVQ